jgi:hypothetical protein
MKSRGYWQRWKLGEYNFSGLTDLDVVLLLDAVKTETPDDTEFIEALLEELRIRQEKMEDIKCQKIQKTWRR